MCGLGKQFATLEWTGAAMPQNTTDELTEQERADFRRLAGFMIPASATYDVPGADDGVIFDDIVRSLDRDRPAVRKALATLRELCGGPFASIEENRARVIATAFLARPDSTITALGRTVLQCYYRDDRVIRSLGLEPRAPYPKGHTIIQGDWSLLDKVRGRPRMWRDVDGKGA